MFSCYILFNVLLISVTMTVRKNRLQKYYYFSEVLKKIILIDVKIFIIR